MNIEQRKFSHHHTFTFETDSIHFAFRDKSGSDDINIPYIEFPLKPSTRIEQNLWLRNVGALWCALGVVQIAFALSIDKPLTGTGFWLLMGLGCLLVAHFTKVTFSVFSTRSGSIWVIQDAKNHDRIIDELRSRRKNQLLALLGEINLENGLDKEVEKFKWLVEQQVLTHEEAEQRITRVRAALLAAPAFPSNTTLN